MPDTRSRLLSALLADLPPEYKVLDLNGDDVTPSNPAVLGAGGSSVVIQASYRGYLKRALKIVIPRDDLIASLDAKHFNASYENEVVRLADLNHEHIAKITDFAVVNAPDGVSFPFIATEYVDGMSLLEFAAHPDTTGEQILLVLHQVVSALDYMHARRIMHCDLKPANILVRRPSENQGPKPSAVIVDLGSSKYIPELPTVSEDKELLYLFSTHKYVMPDLRLVLGNETQNRIARKDLKRYFPFQDLYSFGEILKDLLDVPSVATRLRETLGPADYGSVQFLRNKLRAPMAGRYGDCQKILEALQRLSRDSMAPLGIPELSPIPSSGIVLPTTDGRAAGSDRLREIISHPLFQRMHRLPQLDLLDQVLPGATNTRFAHTLHTYELARSAICHLLADWHFRIEVSSEDVEATLFSAILNALGHYHFLHMFEDFIEDRRREPLIQRAGLLRDDELLDELMGVREPTAGIALANVMDLRGRTLAQIATESIGLDWSDVRRRQQRPEGPIESVLAALLSCPVDVDKLAYLIDDSAATGLPFGRAIAPRPIFEALCLPTQDDWARSSKPSPIILGVKEKAISYLESSVLIRYWNIQTGYWNRANRSLQAMVKYQVASLIQAGAFDFSRFLVDTLHLGSDGALRWLNDRFLEARDQQVIDGDSTNPLEDLLLSRRLIYKRLITISGKSRIANREPDHKIFENLRAMSPLKDEQVCVLIGGVIREVCPDITIKPGDVLLDLPRARREEAGAGFWCTRMTSVSSSVTYSRSLRTWSNTENRLSYT